MIGYIFFWLIIALFSFLFDKCKGRKSLDNILLLLFSFLFVYVIGHLDYQDSGDYNAYLNWFVNLQVLSPEEVVATSYFGFQRGIVFSFIIWSMGQVFEDFRTVFSIIVFVCVIIQLFAIRYYRMNPGVYFLAFFSLYGIGQYTIIRQTLAMTILFWGGRYLISNESKKWITTVLIASLLHSSAIILLGAVFIKKVPISKYGGIPWIMIYIIAIPILLIGNTFFASLWRDGYYLTDSEYVQAGKGIYVALVITLADILCLALCTYKKIKDKKLIVMLNMLMFGLMMQLISVYNYMFVRIAMYFQQFTPYVWINMKECFIKGSKNYIVFLLYLFMFVIYYIRSFAWPAFSLV